MTCLGRLTTRTVQPRPDVESARVDRGHRVHIRLVMIGHDLVRRHAAALDGLSKEGVRTGAVAVLAKEHIHDDAVLVNGAIQSGASAPCGTRTPRPRTTARRPLRGGE